MSGTITLPSGDKLITQTEILGSGALVHREEVVVSGTISGRLALPTNANPSLNDYGLPVREISGPKIGVPGTPLRIDPTGSTTQPVSIASLVTVTHPGTIGVIVTSQPSISFNGPQPISSVAGTVQVAFTPAAVQNVNLMNVGFSGTPLRVDPTGQTTQPVSMAGSISLADYARYSEQLIQSSRLSTIDTDVISIRNAVIGTPAFKFASPQEITWSGTPSVVVSAHPPISFSSPQPISTISGTVNVAFTPAASQNVNLLNVGFSGTPLRIDPTGTTTQPVSIAGTINSSVLTMPALISTNNSTAVALSGNATFTGTGEDVSGYATAAIIVKASHDSAAGGLQFQQSSDNSNWDIIDSYAYVATTGRTYTVGLTARYFRVVYTNGSSAQSSFRLSTLFKNGHLKPSSHRIEDTISGENDAELSKAVLTAKVNNASNYVNVVANASGRLFVTNDAVYNEDTTHTSGDVGMFFLGVRNDSGTVTTSADRDYSPISTDSNGRVGITTMGTPIQASISNTPSFTFSGQQPIHGTVVVSSLPPITFSSAQPISTIAGTVQVAFTPAAIQNVNLMNVGFAGTPLRIDPTGTTVQPVSISGTLSIPDYARYSEQLTQSSRLNSIDTDILLVRDAVIGTPAVKFASPQAITFSGQQPIHGTVVVSSIPSVTVNSLPNITFSGAQPVSSIAGTVQVAFPSAQSVNVTNIPAITFNGQQPVHGTVVISSLPSVAFAGTPSVNIADMPSISLSPITFASPQPISTIAGTVAVAFTPAVSQNVILTTPTTAGSVLALYSEQQLQTTALQLIDDTVHAANAAFSKAIGIGGQRDDESITLATENAVAPVRITSYRAQHVSLRNEIGVEIGSAGTPLRIDPTGTTTQPVSNTVLSVVGGGAEATAQRVTVASDSTGALNVKLLNYGHSGTPLRVDPTGTTTQPVSWTGVPTVSIPGTITANIRNNIFTHKQARIDAHGAGNHTIVAGQANRRIKVYAINAQASAGGTVNIAWMDGNLPMAGTQSYMDREGYVMAVSPPAFLLAPQPGTALIAHMGTILNSGGGLRGWINYWDDDSF